MVTTAQTSTLEQVLFNAIVLTIFPCPRVKTEGVPGFVLRSTNYIFLCSTLKNLLDNLFFLTATHFLPTDNYTFPFSNVSSLTRLVVQEVERQSLFRTHFTIKFTI